MSRADLAQLDAEALILLANRGLVKRATKMIARDQGPALLEADDVVTATFPDGVVTTWPPDTAIEEVSCTCGAHGVCRHRVALALAYEGDADDQPSMEPWDPGEAFTDEALEEHFGKRALTAARRRRTKGMEVRIHRGERPVAHLATGTVRFPVCDALELAYSDVVDGQKGEMVILAVWAFRIAGEGEEVVVRLGAEAAELDLGPLEAVRTVLGAALEHGIANLPGTATADLTRATQRCRKAGWTWMVDALEELQRQQTAWTERSLLHSVHRSAALLGELEGRGRAAEQDAPPSGAWFFGMGVAPESELKHVTLTGLGARARSRGDRVEIEAYLFDHNAHAMLVVQRSIEADRSVQSHRVAGLQLSMLAAGSLTTRGAKRRANRELRLKGQRGMRLHDLRPQAGRWEDMPASVLVGELGAVKETLRSRPPRHLRPRLLAEDLRIVPVAEVVEVVWEAGDQLLVAWCRTPSDETVRVELAHDPATPDAVAAFEGCLPTLTHVAGHVRMEGGELVVTPTALSGAGEVVVPAMARGGVVSSPAGVVPRSPEPVAALLERARDRLAEVAHHGLVRGVRRVEELAPKLRGVGLTHLAGRLELLARERTSTRWADAWLTVEITLERVGL